MWAAKGPVWLGRTLFPRRCWDPEKEFSGYNILGVKPDGCVEEPSLTKLYITPPVDALPSVFPKEFVFHPLLGLNILLQISYLILELRFPLHLLSHSVSQVLDSRYHCLQGISTCTDTSTCDPTLEK